jgi:hypothetical protein
MRLRSFVPARMGFLVAVGLTLLLPTQVAAASWSQPMPLARFKDASPNQPRIASLGGERAALVYWLTNSEDIQRVVVRMTRDGGESWSQPKLITDHGLGPVVAGRGKFVEVAWLWDGRVWFARSDDQGNSFSEPIALSPASQRAGRPSIAHGSGGLVVVAWQKRDSVKARVSGDNGASFGPITTVAEVGAAPQVAAGDGVAYVAYSGFIDSDVIVKRTLDNGASWTGRSRVGVGDGMYNITAEGSEAYVAFDSYTTATYWALLYRQTTNKGGTWSGLRSLLPAGGNGYSHGIVLAGGRVHALYEPCSDGGDICNTREQLWYRRSTDGVTWSTPERVSPKKWFVADAQIGFAGRPVVAYTAYGPAPDYAGGTFIRVRVP